ncbi:hypothetical protein MHK_000786 [Candidatus Magnetomorum sp. HK-1]|nr:hypothetical protein MHK_000786 [Candidatus Magnetomorum sp. HK-1]
MSVKFGLCIKPVQFTGNYDDLLKIGSGLVKNLHPFIGQHYVTDSMSLVELQKCMENGKDYFQAKNALREFPKYNRLGLPYKFDTLVNKQGIIAEHFILALDRYVTPKNILMGITSIPCYHSFNRSYVYGMGDEKLKQLAFVCTGYPEFENIKSNIFIQKVIAHGMHEIGHALGLGHHSPHADKHGKLCPMAKVSKEYLKKKGIPLDHYDLYRRNSFCRRCLKQLKSEFNLNK